MKKFTLGMLAAFAMTGSAVAADMAPRYAKAPPVPVAVYSWTGCYIGGNVGGGQIGCDYQFAGNWVVGIQGMYDYARINSSHAVTAFPTFTSTVRTKDIYTVTGRVGYLFTPQLLGYVKGGGAWATADYAVYQPGGVLLSETAYGANRSGWTVGGGLEWMFAPGWSVFGEYNYMDLGRKDIAFVTAPPAVGNPDILRTKLEVSTALVGVNYKFNFGGPVVAKY